MRLPTIVLLAATILQGCASPNAYVAPSTDDVASISGKWVRSGVFEWESWAIRAIDDRFLSDPFSGHLAELTVPVAPGQRRMLVEATFNRGFGSGGPYQALIPLRFEFDSKRQYQLNGAVKDNVAEAWIEERTSGQKVSEVASSPFRTKPSEGGVVPIFIPRGR